MKQLITTLVSIFVFYNANAQIGELSKELADFKTICEDINRGIVNKNASGHLDRALDMYDDMDIYPMDKLIPVNVNDEAPIAGHIAYTGNYVDSLLIYSPDYQVIKVNQIEFLRGSIYECFNVKKVKKFVKDLINDPGNSTYDCLVVNKAIKPFGKITYKVKKSGNIQIFAAAELGGRINLRIEDKLLSKIYESVSEDGEQMRWICFEKKEFGYFYITVENTTNKVISFVLASK